LEPVVVAERVRLLARALEATRRIDGREVMEGLLHHLSVVGGPTVAHAALERGLAALRAGVDRSLLAATLTHAAGALGALTDFESARRLLDEAKACAEDEHQIRSARYTSAKVAFWACDGGAALALIEGAVLPDDPRARVEMLLILAWAVVTVDGAAAAARGLDYVERAEAILHASEGERAGDPAWQDPVARILCAKARCACFYFSGEHEKVIESAEAAVAIARGAGLRFDECAHLHNAGEQYMMLGQRDRARALLTESRDIARDIGADRNAKMNDVLLAYLDERREALEEMAAHARDGVDRFLELWSTYWLARLLASGRAPEARAALERALRFARTLEVRMMADECERALAALDQ
jgi:tetratricopeptide (TPR) repeat protein